MPTRSVSFAGQHLAIEYPEDLAELMEFLYRDTPHDPSAEPGVKLKVAYEDQLLTLRHRDTELYRGVEHSALATALIQQTIYHLIDNNKDGMALHAAALSRDARAVVLPGTSGSGKTTLSTLLAARGYNYLTDEYVFIEKNSDKVQAFMRPPNIKVGGLDALKSYFDFDRHANQAIKGEHVAMIPPHLLNPVNTPEDAVIKLIVFPKYSEGASFKLEKLSKAKAGLILMECLVNARNLNGHGFTEATRLVRQTPAYRLQYSSFDQFSSEFEEILP